MQVWDDAVSDGCQPDCRMATTLIEVCTRKGDTNRALATYQLMQEAALGSNMAPSVHAYTAAMRAAAEGGAWEKALDIWSDMEQRNCKPTGVQCNTPPQCPSATQIGSCLHSHVAHCCPVCQLLTGRHIAVLGPHGLMSHLAHMVWFCGSCFGVYLSSVYWLQYSGQCPLPCSVFVSWA